MRRNADLYLEGSSETRDADEIRDLRPGKTNESSYETGDGRSSKEVRVENIIFVQFPIPEHDEAKEDGPETFGMARTKEIWQEKDR